MLTLDYTLGIQMVIFLAVMLLLNRLLFRPMLQMIENREQAISGTHKQAEARQKLLEERLSKYNERISQTRKELADKMASVRREAEEELHRRLERVRLEANQQLKDAIELIQQEGEKARQDLRQQVEEISFSIAGRVLGRAIS